MALTYSTTVDSKVAPTRIFQAGVVDLHKTAPLVVPEIVSGATIVEGDGGVGTIRQFNFTEAVPHGYVKERIDLLDMENFEYKYTQIEGGEVGKRVASAKYHFKLVPTADGGCVCTMTAEYTPLPGVEVPEEVINVEKEEAVGMLKAVEEYLLANP